MKSVTKRVSSTTSAVLASVEMTAVNAATLMAGLEARAKSFHDDMYRDAHKRSVKGKIKGVKQYGKLKEEIGKLDLNKDELKALDINLEDFINVPEINF